MKKAILAHGEATGHYHEVIGATVLSEEDSVVKEFHVDENASVKHQEHKEITLPKDTYEVDKVKEYDHFLEEAKNVVD